MNLGEFLDMVMPSIGERCPVTGCEGWQDHFCSDYLGPVDGRCTEHCMCKEG